MNGLRLAALLTLLTLQATVLGCNAGTIAMERLPYEDDYDSGMDMADATAAEDAPARDLFDDTVEPLLAEYCVSCHGAAGSITGYRFLTAEPDLYTAVTTYPALVSRADPMSSRILLSSDHSGPEWSLAQAATVRTWLDREAEEHMDSGDSPELTTEAKLLEPGLNIWSLDVLGLPGSQLSATAMPTAAGWYLSNIEVNAGVDGVKLGHPVMIQWVDASPTADISDRFAGLEVAAPPFTRLAVGGGTASLTGLPEGGSLAWHFDSAGPFADPGTGGGGDDGGVPAPTGGCMNVAAFTATVRPQLNNYCTSCHAGANPDASAAVDMSNVADASDDMAQRLACGEILSRSRGATPSLLRAPDAGGGLSHPFRLSAAQLAAFSAAVLDWAATEAP